MTDPRETLTRIRAQADAATSGPWEVKPYEGRFAETDNVDSIVDPSQASIVEQLGCDCCDVGLEVTPADAEFIAAARTDVPRLVAALEKVLELHIEGRPFIGHGFKQRRCECGATWPCPTVTAITQALTTT